MADCKRRFGKAVTTYIHPAGKIIFTQVNEICDAGAIDIGGAETMAGSEAVDFGGGPGLADVVSRPQDADDADAVFSVVLEGTGDHDFVAYHRAIDHAALSGGEHVALPAGVLEPEEFGQVAGEGDEVGTAIVVEVGYHYLIAAAEIGSERVLDKIRRRRGSQQG